MTNIKVLKFGGTSVGAPERMRQVARLISADEQTKIVVLSALSGTTNNLVSIGKSWKNLRPTEVNQQIETLYDHYLNFLNDLLSPQREQGKAVVDKHFDQIRKLTEVSFNRSSYRELLAQGELMSTKLFHLHLKEISIKAMLIPALEVVSLDEHGEPDIELIANRLNSFHASSSLNSRFRITAVLCLTSYT